MYEIIYKKFYISIIYKPPANPKENPSSHSAALIKNPLPQDEDPNQRKRGGGGLPSS